MSAWRQDFRSSNRCPHGKYDRTRGANHQGVREHHTGERLPHFPPVWGPYHQPRPLYAHPQFSRPGPQSSFWNEGHAYPRGTECLGHRYHGAGVGASPSGHELQRGKRSFAQEHKRAVSVFTDTHLTNATIAHRDLTKAAVTDRDLTNIATDEPCEPNSPSITDTQLTQAKAQVTKMTIREDPVSGAVERQRPSSKKRKKRKRGSNCKRLEEGNSAAVKSYWKKHHTDIMRRDITERFSELLRQTYFIPQDLFYKLRYRKSAEWGHLPRDIILLDKSELGDLSCDRSEVIVRLCLLHITERLQEPMVVLFSYDFEGYLSKPLTQSSVRQLSYEDALKAARKSPILSSEASEETSNAEDRSSVSEGRAGFHCPFKKARELFPSPEDCQDPRSQVKMPGTAEQSSMRSAFARGDFDVLIVSRKYGVVVMEIKSIGDHTVIPEKNVQLIDTLDGDVRKKIEKAVKTQLHKSETLLQHLFSDLPEKVTVVKVLAVPYLKRSRLKAVLEADPDLLKQFCSCLGGGPNADLEEAFNHCLCEEDVGSVEDLCEGTTLRQTEVCARDSPLVSWWQNVIRRPISSEDEPEDTWLLSSAALSDESFVQIVSRFCGMYSTVRVDTRKGHRDEVRTADECIHLTGVRFGRNVLFPAQKLILDRQDRFLCLTGTPGSGKTLILGLKALEWITAGHTVIIVCIKGVEFGTLVSLTIEKQVRVWAGSLPANVHVERLSMKIDVKSFVEKLIREHKGEVLKFVIDEIPRELVRDWQQKKLISCAESLTKALFQIQNSLPASSADLSLDSRKTNSAHSSLFLVAPIDRVKRIQNILNFLEARLEQFKTGGTGEFLPLLDEDFKASLKEIEKLRTQIVFSTKSLTESLAEPDLLEEIYTNLHSALGALFNLYTSLYFLIIHTLMKVLVEKQEEGNVDISVWTASMFPFQAPSAYQKAKLDLCVRCPPSVQAVMELLDRDVSGENASPFTYWNLLGVHNPPLPSTGQRIKLLDHSDHVTQVTEVSDCVECGQALSTYLRDTLNVGSTGPLRPHDVIICGGPVHANNACVFLQKLSQTFAIRLTCSELGPPPPYEDQVFVTAGSILQGLEAKVVVYMPEVKYIIARKGEELEDRDPRADLPGWLQDLGTWNRRQLWFLASRALSHLIVFVCSRSRT